MPENSVVGLNLDTFEDMKEQFAEKEKEYIKKLKKYQDQAEVVIKHVDRIIETMEIQSLVIKRIYEFVGEFSELYKSVSDNYKFIHEDYITSSLNANCDGNSAIFDPTLE